MKNILLAGFLFLISVPLYSQEISQDMKIVNILNNDFIYIPSEDKIYVTTPSSGINGNSLCIIDPYSGDIEDCYYIGSEPNKIALSDNSQYLYIGLDGAPNVVRFDLDIKEVSLTFELGSDPFLGPYYVEDIKVLPNQPNSVVIARRNEGFSPKHQGVAIYDNGVMRPNFTQNHTGSNTLAFDMISGELFGYNNETSEFGFRALTINNSGVTEGIVNSGLITGYGNTIESQANFIYSSKGEVLEIINGLPILKGNYSISSNSYRAAVEPAPDTELVYFITSSFGSNYKLETFDKNTLNLLETKEFSNIVGSIKSLINWGNEGKLAFNTEEAVILLRSCISLYNEPLVLSPSQIAGCLGESIEIVAPDNLPNYHWSTGENTQLITVDQEGEYFFSVIDSLGCISLPSNPVTIEFDLQPPTPYILGNSFIELCSGQSTTLMASGSTSSFSYLWSTGETTQTIEVFDSGTYSVLGISENGCASNLSNSIEIIATNDTIPNPPIIDVNGNTEFCQGESLMLSAPEGFNTYIWSNGENTQTIEVFDIGNYSVQIGNGPNCMSNPSPFVFILVNPTPDTPDIQSNGNVLASSSFEGNQWFLNGDLIIDAVNQFYTATENGFYSVQVTLNGCTSPMSNAINHTIVSNVDLPLDNKILIYPNPANEIINIKEKENLDKAFYKIEIFNQIGQMIFQYSQVNQIGVEGYKPGLYFIKIFDSNNKCLDTLSFTKT